MLLKKNRYFFVLLLILFFFHHNLFPSEKEYYQINRLITLFNLEIDYDQLLGSLTLKKNGKNVTILLDSPYILLGDKQIFTNDYIKSENGQFLVPKDLTEKICNHLLIKTEFIEKKDEYEKRAKNGYFLNVRRGNLSDLENKKTEKSFAEKLTQLDLTDDKVEVKDKYIYEKKPENVKINAIIVDPGHGGEDPGAIGYSGTKEKDIVLKTSLILADKLRKLYPDKKIVLTRDSDVFIPLDKRANIANYVFNKYGTSLFVSVHVNASRSTKSYGFETWYLVEEYRRKIIKDGEISDDTDVESALNSMLNDEIYKESRELASLIQKNLKKQIEYVSLDRGVKEQTYFVIKKSIMPAVLVEIGFNTNKYEEIRLTRYSYLNKIADGIFEGINEFIEGYEKTYGYTK